jgi:predicted O-methyltransferase YrrM
LASKQIKIYKILRTHNLITLILDYLKYQLIAKNADKIHSPFVFDWYYNHLLAHKNYYAFKQIEVIRNELYDNKNVILPSPLGAGSRKSNNEKKVSEIAKTSSIQHKYGAVLFELVNHFKAKTIIEIGACMGISSLYLALADSDAKVYAIDGHQPYLDIAKENALKANAGNINFIHGNFDETLPEVLNKINQVDLVFFDGNHQEEATLKYFELCIAKKYDNSIFVFDDIYWSTGMKRAWAKIKSHPEVSITLDLFQLGIVFFRKGIVKQDFVLEY